MSQPVLIIVAGCNGAGKSTYSRALVKESIVPFDYDKRFKEIYESLRDSEFREVMAKNMTTDEFTTSITNAFSEGRDFCYETNLDSNPLHWAEIAKQHGYYVELHFFCIESIELAQQRVKSRAERNGHYVYEEVVMYKWKEGYKNLNKHYKFFDYITLIENSSPDREMEYICSLIKDEDTYKATVYADTLPKYSSRRFPDIYNLITSK